MASYQEVTFASIIKGSFFDNQRFKLYSDSAYTLPIDLTGCTIKAQLRTTPKSPPQYTWSTEDDTITISGTDNNFVNLIGTNLDINPGQYYSDIDITFPSGAVRTYIRFKLTILDEYTNG